MEELKAEIENLFRNLIEKYGLRTRYEDLEWDVINIKKQLNGLIRVCFNDENMTYLLAGYVSETIWNEIENEVKKLGYHWEDTDGCCMYLREI
jgi:hypothetical protein